VTAAIQANARKKSNSIVHASDANLNLRATKLKATNYHVTRNAKRSKTRLARRKRRLRDSNKSRLKGFNERRPKGSRPKWKVAAKGATTAETAEISVKLKILVSK